MKKRISKYLSLLLAILLLLLCITGCSGGGDNPDEPSSEVLYKIGVAVYDTTDPEMSMFYSYYRDYIQESFPVEFYLSDSISTSDDEVAFINEMKKEGAIGIISFYGLELEKVVAACAENEMYYVLGSGSISDEEFNAVKDNEYFLGVIGPNEDEEYNAGVEMAEFFAQEGAGNYLILSGGAANAGNFMHYTRTCGILDTLASELGLTYTDSVENLAQAAEITTIETGTDVTITISPGYLNDDEGKDNFIEAIGMEDYDAIMSAAGVANIVDELRIVVRDIDHAVLVGAVDCFSVENYDAFQMKDNTGASLLNFIKGKYASMVAPAFVAMFNAAAGDMDVVKPEGEAFRIYQSYWTADSEAEYSELYGYTESIYENAYSSTDLMSVIKTYSETASFEAFKTLTESCDIDSVRARIEG